MEAQVDLQTYLEQGRQALAQGQGREAAIAYAHAAQVEPHNPLVHLGLAEANLALGSYGIVEVACRKTQELATSGPLYELAQALLDLLARRYPQALQHVDAAIQDDPGNAYVHALRSYLLRITRQDYDAGLARARASRLSFGGTFENCFPPVEPVYASGYSVAPTAYAPPAVSGQQQQQVQAPQQNDTVPPWQRPSNLQRRAVRTRFWMSQNPRFVTYVLIGLCVIGYLVTALVSHEFLDFTDAAGQNALVQLGGQWNALVGQGQVWRIFTAMFLHYDILHIGLNMLSLYFVGSVVELFYGKWRYLTIYLVSGIIAGIVSYYFNTPDTLSVGASGAIFGAFGALGAFFIVNRRILGPAGNAMIGQWFFWLILNLFIGFSVSGIDIQDHIGGLISGLILGVVLLPPLRRRTRRV